MNREPLEKSRLRRATVLLSIVWFLFFLLIDISPTSLSCANEAFRFVEENGLEEKG